MTQRSLFDLSGKVALVVGGTRGMGRAISLRLAQHGAHVAVSSRNQSACEQTAAAIRADCRASEEIAIGKASDLNDLDSLRALVAFVEERWGTIDILVATAALIPPPAASLELASADLEKTLRANITANLILAQEVAVKMRERRAGSIIFITSGAAFLTMPRGLAYGVSKAGLTHMARILALELAPHNIRVNCVSPGMFRGDAPASQRLWNDPQLYAEAVKPIPLQRGGEADEIAAAVIYLASPGGAYVTGITIPVDGGAVGTHTMPRP